MKTLITTLLLFLGIVTQAQNIFFTDVNLKNAIIAAGVDTNSDGQISIVEAHAVTSTLNLSANSISNPTGLSYFINMTGINLSNNQITNIDFTNNTALTTINISSNELNRINLTDLSNLIELKLSNNNLQGLHLNTNTALSLLYADNNLISEVEFLHNRNITRIHISHNKLTELDLHGLPDLLSIDCSFNNLTTLNLRNVNTSIDSVICNDNHLVNFDYVNGTDGPLIELNALNNNDLSCMAVSNPSTFFHPTGTLPPVTSLSTNCDEQIYIPDIWFEFDLLQQGLDTGNGGVIDHKISLAEAQDIINLDINGATTTGSDITDLRGIEYFVYLETIDAHNNNISEIDLTQNTRLQQIRLDNNNISSIDLSTLTDLFNLRLKNNNLSSIDVSNNIALQNLDLNNNYLTSLDLTYNTALTSLYGLNNQITSINLFNNTNLATVNMNNNQLNNIAFANHPNLQKVYCEGNGMSGIVYIGSATTNLLELKLNDNQLENSDINISSNTLQVIEADNNLLSGELDLNDLSSLTRLTLANNINLETIRLRNGNNTNIIEFDASGCTNLSIVCVDDVAWSTSTSGWSVDDTNVYSTCAIDIPDSNFEQALIDLGIDTYHDVGSPDVPNGMINTYDVEGLTFLNIENKGIHNFSGIEYFTDLETLYISNNPLSTTTIDLSNLSNLKIFFANNCNLNTSYLTLPTSSSLKRLSLNDNFDLETHGFDALISGQTELKYLSFTDNNVVSIDVTNFPNIEELYCSNNPDYEELDLSNATHLKKLKAINCHLDVVNLSTCVELSDVDISHNNIHALTFGSINNINFLRCSDNQLTTLDVSSLSGLDLIRCNINQLTTLDLSQNRNITGIYAGNNLFTEINLKNGYTSIMKKVWIIGNPNLTCVQVDDATIDYPSISGNNWLYDAGTSFSENCSARTYVPDNNFEQALIDLGYDNVLDDYVLTSNINTIASIDLGSKNITNFTGINDFTAMQYLICDDNPMTSIDISGLDNLYRLVANNCPSLSSLNIQNDSAIETLELANCNFDYVNGIFDKTPLLKNLYINNNQLVGDLELFDIPNLEIIDASNNGYESIDITETPLLNTIIISNNPVEFLELNSLSHLIQLVVNNCSLQTLEVKNSNNTNVSYFDARNNPLLTCIEVDNVAYSATNWSNIDSVSSFDTDCSGGVTYVPDNGFEQALIDLGYDTAMDNYVITDNINNITNLNISDKSINNLTGIEDFVSLFVLDITNNNLHSLNVYNSPNLKILLANGNDLTSINVTDNPLLEVLRINDSQLSNIELKFNTALKIFSGERNAFTALNFNFNTNLEKVLVGGNQLESLNIKNGNNGIVTTFNTVNNPNLFCINVDNPTYSTTNWTHIDSQTSFDDHCGQTYVPDDNFEQALISKGYDDIPDNYVLTSNINTLTRINLTRKNISDLTGIEDFEMLESLYVQNNNLTTLDIRNLSHLTDLVCNNNSLILLQLPPSIAEIKAGNNQLANLNLGFAINLTEVHIDDNQLTNISLPTSSVLVNLFANNNQLSGINLSNQTHLENLYLKNNNISNINIDDCSAIENIVLDDNQFTSINLFGHNSLESLSFANNQLTNANLSGFNNLKSIIVNSNQLTQLDISHNTLLEWLVCGDNQLTQINLSANTELIIFYAPDNQLTILDFSNNPNLEAIYCQNNQLTQVDLRNGNNSIIDDTYNIVSGTVITFIENPDFRNNPNLTCVEVDNPAWSTSNWTNVDAQTNFNANCDANINVTIVGNGDVSTNPSSSSCYSGGSIELTATPDAGWKFTGWSGDITSTTNPLTVTMDSDKYITATFTQIQHTLTTNTVGYGNVSVSPSGTIFNEGYTVQITAIPDTGWQFNGWSGDYIGIDNPATVTMNVDKNITATFTQIEYTLDISITGNGNVSNTPTSTTYHYGDVVELTATPDVGWEFSRWEADLSGTTNPENITINDYKTVRAIFTRAGTINGNTLNQTINIYPNPTRNMINIDVINNLTINKISIMNMEGKILWQQNCAEKISLQNLEKGIYFIKINTPKGTLIKKIIKK